MINPASSFGGQLLSFVHEAYTSFCLSGEGEIDNSSVMKYFNNQLFKYFQPDINGYILVFFVPPPFTLLNKADRDKLKGIQKFMTFAAIDFTPPTIEVTSSNVATRSGGMPFATEVSSTNQISVTYLDNKDLSIFAFHSGWIEYIRGMLDGVIPDVAPDSFPKNLLPDDDGIIEDGIDYIGSLFIVKYDPSMQQIKYIGKCTGIYPQNSSPKEIIGQRSTNELSTLPITYNCVYYEETLQSTHPIWTEFKQVISVFD